MANEPKIAGVLSAIASGIAIIIYLTGKTSIPDFFIGTKLTRQLEERPVISNVDTEIPALDTAAIREIVTEEFKKRDTLTPPVQGGGVPDPPDDSVQVFTNGECDLNGRVYGSSIYIHFFNKNGNKYKFNGATPEPVSGYATVSGNTISIKGEDCNGELNLFNECGLLEGRIKLRYYYVKFREVVQTGLSNE
jgi:hypothetical protein